MESACIDDSSSLSDEKDRQGRMKEEDESKSQEIDKKKGGDESECWRE